MAGNTEQAGCSLKQRSPNEVRVVRASGNEINFEEEIVMSDISTAVAKSNVIPFRSSKLLLVERDGQPFVPMKPVVEGMGLDWKTQYRKLQGGRFNSVMVMMTTTGSDGKTYEMSCLPLRKLAGWLMSVHASKVRIDLRENVLAYQNECDDVLWAYWNEGSAVSERSPGQGMTLIGQTIGTDGFHMLGSVVRGKVANLPVVAQRRATAKIWSQTHSAFGVRSAADIPAEQLDAARNFIASYSVHEGEFIPKGGAAGVELPAELSPTQRFLVFADGAGNRQVQPIPIDACVMTHRELIQAMLHTGGVPVSADEMLEFAMAALTNLKARLAVVAKREAA